MKLPYPHISKIIEKYPQNSLKGNVHLKHVYHFKFNIQFLIPAQDLREYISSTKEAEWLRKSAGRELTRRELGNDFIREVNDREMKRRSRRFTYKPSQ